MLIYFKI